MSVEMLSLRGPNLWIHLAMSFVVGLSHYAFCDNDLGVTLQRAESELDNRNYAECLPDFLAVLKVYEEQNNEKGIADVSYKIGRANRKLSKFEDADRCLTRALKMHQQLGDDEAAGLDLTEWAVSRERVGAYDEALDLTAKALAINEKTGNRDALARTLENFANTYYRQGNYTKAIEFFNRSIPHAVESGNKETLMNIRQNMGQVYFVLNEFDKALECYDKSMKLAEEIGDPRLLGVIQGNQAILYWSLGELEKARSTFEKNLVPFEQAGFKQHLANTYENLGAVEMDLGDYGKAQQYLLKSLELAGELKDNGLAAVSMNSLASLHIDLANYDLAQDYLQRSIQLSQETGERREAATTMKYLGQVFEMQRRYQEALELYGKALKVNNELGEKNRIANSLEAIGDVYEKMGDHDRALQNHKEALALRETVADRVGIGSSNMKIGWSHYNKGDLVDAENAFTTSIDTLRDAGSQLLLWRALYGKAVVYRDTGKTAEATELMKEAVGSIEKLRSTVELPEQRWSYLEDKVKVFEDLVQLLVQTHDLPGAFEYAEKSKARAFLDLLMEARVNPDQSLNTAQYSRKRQLIAKMVDLNTHIQEQYQTTPQDKGAIRQLKEKENRLNDEYQKIMVRIRAENPRYEQLQRPQALKLAAAQSMIDSRTAIAEYFVGKKNSVLFLITSGNLRAFNLPGDEKLNQQVHELVQAIQKPETAMDLSTGSFARYREIAALIYAETLKPAENLLRGKARLIVIPDGALNYVPFEALLTVGADSADFSTLPYLALRYEIQYAPSVSALAALRESNRPHTRTKDLIAFADPDISGSNQSQPVGAVFREWSASLANLPYARAEVDAISGLYPAKRVTVFTGKDASESNVKKADLKEYRVLHFASHGLIDEEQPQFSALVLTPGDSREDGFFTMREVFDLKLDADLVVLSACKSGLGKQVRGEGIAGLSRAFFSAGTSNVLVSLWNVYDLSTSQFMTSFYQRLQEKGVTKAAALQQARAQMIHSEKFSHPYYWAPFILIGAN